MTNNFQQSHDEAQLMAHAFILEHKNEPPVILAMCANFIILNLLKQRPEMEGKMQDLIDTHMSIIKGIYDTGNVFEIKI